ncbi:uncharacterized protein [Macrobrachium rosenbergii]|uniref:uncharacterized protein n=1 Tax=Macrobrachium rosenbergii TaxID=79674 RepID=UPI0034D421D3
MRHPGRREIVSLQGPLGLQPVGPQHSLERTGLELVQGASPTSQVPSTPIPGLTGLCRRTPAEECNKESQTLEISRPSVQCSEEGLRQAESNSGPVPSQFIHSTRQIPHAYNLTGTDPTSSWGRHHLYRSYRRILSRPFCEKLLPLPGIQTRKTSLLLQGHAIRAQHHIPNFYQTGRQSSKSCGPKGSCWLRIWTIGLFGHPVSKSNPYSHQFLGIPRFPNKQEEITLSPSSSIPVARDSLGPQHSQTVFATSQEKRNSQSYQTVPQKQACLSSYPGKDSRLSSVCFRNRLAAENQTERHKQGLVSLSQQAEQRQTFSDPQILRKRLRPWSTVKLLSRSVPLQFPPPSLVVHTDASLSGWGGYSQHGKVQGTWSTVFHQFHINILEAMAVFLTLKKLRPARQIHIRLVLDNAVIVHCLNRGGSKSGHINQVMIAIFSLARKHCWHLSATHLAGVWNVIADSLSRTTPLESEWSLDKKSFAWIYLQVPGLQLDLFATESNHKLPCYVAPNLDPLASSTDAMTIDWNRWQRIYLFPPVNLLMKVLHKLRSFRGRVALVAPNWPKSSWFPLLLELKLTPRPIPNPQLTQIVQTRIMSASSRILSALALWIS